MRADVKAHEQGIRFPDMRKLAILIGLALPQLAVALYFGIAVYLIVPFREVARLLSRRS